MRKHSQNQSYAGSSGQTLTRNVSMTLWNWQIRHQTHVLCGCTTFVPNHTRYQINTVPTPAVALTRAWLLQKGGGGGGYSRLPHKKKLHGVRFFFCTGRTQRCDAEGTALRARGNVRGMRVRERAEDGKLGHTLQGLGVCLWMPHDALNGRTGLWGMRSFGPSVRFGPSGLGGHAMQPSLPAP